MVDRCVCVYIGRCNQKENECGGGLGGRWGRRMDGKLWRVQQLGFFWVVIFNNLTFF
ncbi:hypothetical protein Hanom_Chr09g00855571 [Helianthus anomalus]